MAVDLLKSSPRNLLMRSLSRRLVTAALVAAVVPALLAASGEAAQIDFNRDVRPILSDKCFQCHGPDESAREADLRIDDEEIVKASRELAASGMPGQIVKPGDPQGSELIRRITSTDEYEIMPPPEANKPLTAKEIETLRQWISQGAAWSQHWAYVTPRKARIPQAPGIRDADGMPVQPQNWIDNFILARLEQEGLTAAPAADPVTLLRRVCFDLTGLPPSSALAREFLSDRTERSAAAYGRLVDRLLDSPHYGERMAMYWLDLVRYADTVGYHGDQVQNISPYRDWVIEAFNENVPFDQFTREQLGGDLLPDPTQRQIIATGYNRLLQTTHEGGLQVKEYRAIYAADRVRNVSAVWMGATVGCAQCHDHKFDPYTARDFYSLGAFFADVDDEDHFTSGTNDNPTSRRPELELPTPAQSRQLADVTARLDDVQAELKQEGLSDAQQKEIKDRVKKAEADLKRVRSSIRRTMITVALPQPRVVHVLPRGNWLDESGPIVDPAVPEFLPDLNATAGRATRLDLANWLVDPQQGVGLLTARVMVNRLWYLCFGSGLAGDLDDFGGQGQPPVHPELLDRLAHAFVESGWDVRAMLRLIVSSRTYQQSSALRSGLAVVDPNNRLYARQSAFRLPAEMIRDNALAIGGLLVQEVGGESVKPYQPAGYYRHLNFPQREYHQDNDEQQWRRGVYVHWQRQFLHPMLKAFDAPSREECTAQRARSNTPLAALTLLNDPTFIEAARSFAARSLEQSTSSDAERLSWAFETALTRAPTDHEQDVLLQLLEENRESFAARLADARELLDVGLIATKTDAGDAELAAWTAVCRALLNLAETNTRN